MKKTDYRSEIIQLHACLKDIKEMSKTIQTARFYKKRILKELKEVQGLTDKRIRELLSDVSEMESTEI